ncbi:MAG: hypothetical protein KKG59_00055 [Nanoarchaeota archaeon]|nr:hypothetical protein [Nanoarchaeota archaeon]
MKYEFPYDDEPLNIGIIGVGHYEKGQQSLGWKLAVELARSARKTPWINSIYVNNRSMATSKELVSYMEQEFHTGAHNNIELIATDSNSISRLRDECDLIYVLLDANPWFKDLYIGLFNEMKRFKQGLRDDMPIKPRRDIALPGNMEPMITVAKGILGFPKNVVIGTNPAEILAPVLCAYSGIPTSKITTLTLPDQMRTASEIASKARKLGLFKGQDFTVEDCHAIGQHTQFVPLLSLAKINGEYIINKHILGDHIAQLMDDIPMYAPRFLAKSGLFTPSVEQALVEHGMEVGGVTDYQNLVGGVYRNGHWTGYTMISVGPKDDRHTFPNEIFVTERPGPRSNKLWWHDEKEKQLFLEGEAQAQQIQAEMFTKGHHMKRIVTDDGGKIVYDDDGNPIQEGCVIRIDESIKDNQIITPDDLPSDYFRARKRIVVERAEAIEEVVRRNSEGLIERATAQFEIVTVKAIEGVTKRLRMPKNPIPDLDELVAAMHSRLFLAGPDGDLVITRNTFNDAIAPAVQRYNCILRLDDDQELEYAQWERDGFKAELDDFHVDGNLVHGLTLRSVRAGDSVYRLFGFDEATGERKYQTRLIPPGGNDNSIDSFNMIDGAPIVSVRSKQGSRICKVNPDGNLEPIVEVSDRIKTILPYKNSMILLSEDRLYVDGKPQYELEGFKSIAKIHGDVLFYNTRDSFVALNIADGNLTAFPSRMRVDDITANDGFTMLTGNQEGIRVSRFDSGAALFNVAPSQEYVLRNNHLAKAVRLWAQDGNVFYASTTNNDLIAVYHKDKDTWRAEKVNANGFTNALGEIYGL